MAGENCWMQKTFHWRAFDGQEIEAIPPALARGPTLQLKGAERCVCSDASSNQSKARHTTGSATFCRTTGTRARWYKSPVQSFSVLPLILIRKEKSLIHIFKNSFERAFSIVWRTFASVLKSLRFLIIFDLDPTLMLPNSLSKEIRSESGQTSEN